MILCKVAGEEQAVPVLVRRQFHEVVNALKAGTFIAFVAQRPTTRTETIAHKTLLNGHVTAIVLFMYRQVFQRGLAGRLCQKSGLSSYVFEQLAVSFRQGNWHRASSPQRITGPSF